MTEYDLQVAAVIDVILKFYFIEPMIKEILDGPEFQKLLGGLI